MRNTNALANVYGIRRTQRADGPAAMLAVGTANPTNCVLRDDFPTDFYFRATKIEHLTGLKAKFQNNELLSRAVQLGAEKNSPGGRQNHGDVCTTVDIWLWLSAPRGVR
ncbi:unnamed protein product [Urochloa humidicola]